MRINWLVLNSKSLVFIKKVSENNGHIQYYLGTCVGHKRLNVKKMDHNSLISTP